MKTRLYLTLLSVLGALMLIFFVTSGSSSLDSSSSTSESVYQLSSSSGDLVTLGGQTEIDSIPSFTLGKALMFNNLEVVQILGTFKNERQYITLQQALSEGLVVLNETSNVSELVISNNSDSYIYLQSGDIVKGGKQDRTLQMDVILPPKAQDVAIASFCVERGRWGMRNGSHETDYFLESPKSLSSKDLKLANRKYKNQSQVWSEVSKQQLKLDSSLNKKYANEAISVQSDASATSYQLSLENEVLNKEIKQYTDALNVLRGKNVVGLAYAIDGVIYGAEIYNNAVLDSLFGKLIESFATEAVSLHDSAKNQAQRLDAIHWVNFISQPSDLIRSNYQKINSHTGYLAEENTAVARFTSFDIDLNQWLHISILPNEENPQPKRTPPPPPPREIVN